MKNSTLLIVAGVEASLTDIAANLEAVRDLSVHVTFLLLGETPGFPYYAVSAPPYGTVVIPEEWQRAVSENKAGLKDKADAIEELLGQHNVSGEVRMLAAEPAQIADQVARHAMVCDRVIVTDDLRDISDTAFKNAVHGVLFQSPVGVLLNDPKLTALCATKTVLVAWNTQLHAARALQQALPIIRQAERIIIAVVDPASDEYRDGEDPGVDVAKWLTHHGCKVEVQQFPSGGQSVGHTILARAGDIGADLIVMGAYSHSRMRQALFGGTTCTLIEQRDRAVFLAH
jgi:nucleotide-binding universal stress UspA family protein